MPHITLQNLRQAAKANIISLQQAEALFQFLQQQENSRPRFNLTHLLYYFGGLIAIGAMTVFMNLGWESFGGWGLVGISLSYAVLAIFLCQHFKKQGHLIPAGLTASLVICLTPLAVYGLQQAMGWWPSKSHYQDYHRYVQWQWLYMELATLAVGLLLSWIYRFPFMLFPISVTLWYLSMDVAVMLTGERPDYQFRALVSMYFGLMMCLIAFWVDIRSRHSADYAFWLYLFGVLSFWGGLSMQQSDSELTKLVYCLINLGLMLCGVILVRRVFVIFGSLGCCYYLYHLSYSVFKDSWLFPISLSLLGLALVYLGILWQKKQHNLSQRLRSYLPLALQQLLENKQH
ncbi:DUF2157 domain-containing protein [Agarivorans sp. QJM3NY_29]|uniref:DUF2157 domain-containing protein n=1 Tax=unclassified Agarivorans TaxID=2636026 RepID=UPI003D7D2F6C